jgi:cyclohexanone monooxygenase
MTPPRIAVIGAGPGGLCMAIRLKRAGIGSFTVYEAADGVGGTWRHNRYPGAACDTRTHFYAYSFAPNPDWPRAYAHQPEILAYLERCVTRFGVRPHLRLNTPIVSARWQEDQTWLLQTADGRSVTADVVVSAVGMLNVPKLPEIPGRADFAGTAFHSARWDTGHDLTGRDVAVIGSGASAVQIAPSIAGAARRLHVFQRSPGWVIPKFDKEFSVRERRRLARVPLANRLERARIFWRAPTTIGFDRLLRGTTPLREVALNLLREQVHDEQVRRALTPDYPFGCKRLLISSDYLPTFNRSNVELVTTPIERISAAGVVTVDGRERPVDTLIYATGFNAVDYLSTVDVTGRGGTRLHDLWKDAAYAYLGMTVPGFPNLFLLYGPNTNQGSITFMLECQVRHVLNLVRGMAAGRYDLVEADERRTEAYNRRLDRRFTGAVWHHCTNYFTTATGRIPTQYPYSSPRYWLETRLAGRWAYHTSHRGRSR